MYNQPGLLYFGGFGKYIQAGGIFVYIIQQTNLQGHLLPGTRIRDINNTPQAPLLFYFLWPQITKVGNRGHGHQFFNPSIFGSFDDADAAAHTMPDKINTLCSRHCRAFAGKIDNRFQVIQLKRKGVITKGYQVFKFERVIRGGPVMRKIKLQKPKAIFGKILCNQVMCAPVFEPLKAMCKNYHGRFPKVVVKSYINQYTPASGAG